MRVRTLEYRSNKGQSRKPNKKVAEILTTHLELPGVIPTEFGDAMLNENQSTIRCLRQSRSRCQVGKSNPDLWTAGW